MTHAAILPQGAFWAEARPAADAAPAEPAPVPAAEPPDPGDGRSPGRRRGGRRISTILLALTEAGEGDRVSFGDLVDAFEMRAFGPLIVLFAAPNVLPVALPGISAVLGAPLILLTGQLMLGRRLPWLPGFVRRRSVGRRDFTRLVERIVPRLQRLETMVRPRYLAVTGAFGKRMVGALGLILATIIFLPVPFGNMLPGLALVLMAVGVLGRDGLAVLVGGAVGTMGLAVVSGFIWGAVLAALLFARHGLGI